jgi:hypothetical protein
MKKGNIRVFDEGNEKTGFMYMVRGMNKRTKKCLFDK